MKNPNHSQRISFYPKQIYRKLLTAYAFVNSLSKSEAEREINKRFFDSMPNTQRDALVVAYEDMTVEQKNFPRKNN